MSDNRLRQLEREAANDSGARSRWLAERLRAGTLTRDRLELAVYCEDEAAQTVLAGQWVWVSVRDQPGSGRVAAERYPGALQIPWGDLAAWARGLVRWGREACVRAALAVQHPLDDNDRAAAAAAEAWLACPCEKHAAPCRSFNMGPPNPCALVWQVHHGPALEREIVGEAEHASGYLGNDDLARRAMSAALIAWALA